MENWFKLSQNNPQPQGNNMWQGNPKMWTDTQPRFWQGIGQNQRHTFRHNPTLVQHGNALSWKGYQDTHRRSRAGGMQAQNSAQLMQETMGAFQQIMRAEQGHSEELQNLAIKTVAKMMKFPEEKLQAMLSHDVEKNDTAEEFKQHKNVPVSPEMRNEINKRIIMNGLTQGSAVHNMMTAHNFQSENQEGQLELDVAQELNQIDPQLVALYKKFAAGSHMGYWMMDFDQMSSEMLSSSAAGSSKVVQDEQGEHVEAAAACFPVLVQELCKGVMEFFGFHHLAEMAKEMQPTQRKQFRNTVLLHADDVLHEPWLIQIGPEFWRTFLKVVNSTPQMPSMPMIVAKLNKAPPQQVIEVANAILSDSPQAGQMLLQIVGAVQPQVEEEPFDEYQEPTEFGQEEYGGEEENFGGNEEFPSDDDDTDFTLP